MSLMRRTELPVLQVAHSDGITGNSVLASCYDGNFLKSVFMDTAKSNGHCFVFLKKKKARGAKVNLIRPLKDWPLSVGSGKMFIVPYVSVGSQLTGMSWFSVWCFHEDTVILCPRLINTLAKRKTALNGKQRSVLFIISDCIFFLF